MRFIRCDRCGKEMPWKDTDNVGHVALRWKDIRTDELAGLNPYEDVEFCDDCMRAISDFIEKKPAIVAAEPAAAEKPKAGYSARRWKRLWRKEDEESCNVIRMHDAGGAPTAESPGM